jgi:hypothetical protein
MNHYCLLSHYLSLSGILETYKNVGGRVAVVAVVAVALLVEALHYNPGGREFDSRWCHWNFSVTKSFRSHSISNRNEYQVYFLGIRRPLRKADLTTILCRFHEIWEP